ncbi:MAG: hypothetical protein KA715_02705 [Xanthomonadaceae bacterium]|nr:hypothetical protein [Xanthomonadaceae bacterium]
MKKARFLILSTIITVISSACGSGSTCTKVTIPTLTIKCNNSSLPCSAGGYLSSSSPYYVLGAYIITGTTCNSTTMQSTKASASGGNILTSDASVYDGTNYSLQVGTATAGFVDSKGASVTTLCTGTYTVCAYYGSVTGSSLFVTYFQKLGSFSLASPSSTTIGPTGWTAL